MAIHADPEIRAQVLADAGTRQYSISEIARRNGVARSTVQRWLAQDGISTDALQNDVRAAYLARMSEHLIEYSELAAEALKTQVKLMGEIGWLRTQDGSDVANVHRVIGETLGRFVEAEQMEAAARAVDSEAESAID